ncbi:hypothetical protein GCM10027589_48570 [Actinocorallia lasiicapitis]
MRIDRAELLGGEVPFRPVGVAEMMDTALAVMRRCPRAVLAPAAAVVTLVQVGLTLVEYYFAGPEVADSDAPEEVLRAVGSQFVFTVIGLSATGLAILVLAGFYAPVIARSFFDLPAEPWRDGRPRRFAVLAVAVAGMVWPVLLFLLCLAPFILVAGTDGSAAAGIVLGLLGFPAGLALAFWVYVLVVLAAPAIVMERLSVVAALGQARRLVKGAWWRTFFTLLLASLITVFMGFVALRLPFVLIGMLAFGSDPQGGAEVGALAVDTLGRIVSWTITVPFDALVISSLYFNRRMRREGVDLRLQTLRELPSDFMALWGGR